MEVKKVPEKRPDNQGSVHWLWYFRTYARQKGFQYDADRLERFYLDGNLDSALWWDFTDWLETNGYMSHLRPKI